ncbi:hypothetical protein [Bounagaea algeriensis]
MNPETPEADAAEQAREEQLFFNDEETPGSVPEGVDAADMADQERTIPAEDDYDY